MASIHTRTNGPLVRFTSAYRRNQRRIANRVGTSGRSRTTRETSWIARTPITRTKSSMSSKYV